MGAGFFLLLFAVLVNIFLTAGKKSRERKQTSSPSYQISLEFYFHIKQTSS